MCSTHKHQRHFYSRHRTTMLCLSLAETIFFPPACMHSFSPSKQQADLLFHSCGRLVHTVHEPRNLYRMALPCSTPQPHAHLSVFCSKIMCPAGWRPLLVLWGQPPRPAKACRQAAHHGIQAGSRDQLLHLPLSSLAAPESVASPWSTGGPCLPNNEIRFASNPPDLALIGLYLERH